MFIKRSFLVGSANMQVEVNSVLWLAMHAKWIRWAYLDHSGLPSLNLFVGWGDFF